MTTTNPLASMSIADLSGLPTVSPARETMRREAVLESAVTICRPEWEYAGTATVDPSVVLTTSDEYTSWIGDAAAAEDIYDTPTLTARPIFGSRSGMEVCRRDDAASDKSMLSPSLALDEAKHAVATLLSGPDAADRVRIWRQGSGYRVQW